MKLKNLLLYFLLVSCTSCVTIVKWKYGITNPKEQTPGKIISFLERHKYSDSCQFIFADSVSYCQSLRNPAFRKNLLSEMIFDSKGSLLQRDTSKCQWSGYDAIKALNTDSTYYFNKGLQLDEILKHVQQIGPGSRQDSILRDPDFTVVITWAKFLGTFNARLFDLSDAVKQNKTARIRLIWLNVDMQQSWKLSKDQKMAFN